MPGTDWIGKLASVLSAQGPNPSVDDKSWPLPGVVPTHGDGADGADGAFTVAEGWVLVMVMVRVIGWGSCETGAILGGGTKPFIGPSFIPRGT